MRNHFAKFDALPPHIADELTNIRSPKHGCDYIVVRGLPDLRPLSEDVNVRFCKLGRAMLSAHC